jgi:hypothetical protein
MITYKWNFFSFDCKVNDNGLQNVVKTINWIFTGTNENGIYAEIFGVQNLSDPNPEDFTPYSEISKEQVIQWIESVNDLESLKSEINEIINEKINPIYIKLPPNFNQ